MPRTLPCLAVLALLPACAARVSVVAPIAPPLAITAITVANNVPIGTAHPFKLVDSDPHARWVVLCQAREDTDGDGKIVVGDHYPRMQGDALRPYLILGPGPGIALEDYIGSDRTGEHLVFLKHDRLLVHHVSAGRTEVLRDAELLDDADTIYPFTEHRAAAMDRERHMLAYHLTRRSNSTLVVRDLESGNHHLVPLPGLLHRATFADGGHWLLLSLLTHDTDDNGLLALSRNDRPLGPRACFGVYPLHHGSPDHEGDRPEMYAVPVKGGPPRPVPGLIDPIGDQLLLRELDGSIVAMNTDGKRREWVPGACFAQILGTSIAHQRVLVLCDRDRPAQAHVAIHGPGIHHPLRARPKPERWSYDAVGWDRFGSFEAVDGEYVIDLVNFNEWRVPDGHRLRTVNEHGAVLAAGEQFQQWDLLTGTMTPTSDPWAFLREHGYLYSSLDGRTLNMAHPPPQPKPIPPRDPNTPQVGTRVVVDDFPEYHRSTLPKGPLVWRTPSQ